MRTVRISEVAALLWPANPKRGHAAVSGRMLKACPVVRRVDSDQWEILAARLSVLEVEELRQIYPLTNDQQLQVYNAPAGIRQKLARDLSSGWAMSEK